MAKESFKGIGINMGHPVANVVENGKGTGLIHISKLYGIFRGQILGSTGECENKTLFHCIEEWRD